MSKDGYPGPSQKQGSVSSGRVLGMSVAGGIEAYKWGQEVSAFTSMSSLELLLQPWLIVWACPLSAACCLSWPSCMNVCPALHLDSLTQFPSLPGTSSLCEASPHPWADQEACPSALPMWLLGQTMSPPHKGIDVVSAFRELGPQSPKTQSKRHKLWAQFLVSRWSLLMIEAPETQRPRPEEFHSRLFLHLFQFPGPSLLCLLPWPQFCFISLILHLRTTVFFSCHMTRCFGRSYNGKGEHKLWLQAGLAGIPAPATWWLAVETSGVVALIVSRHSKNSKSHRSCGYWLALGYAMLHPFPSFRTIFLSSTPFSFPTVP